MKFIASDNELTIQFEGAEIFFGLRRKLVIPKANITNIDWQPAYTLTSRVWRLAGAGIPGVLCAGYFRGGGQRYYLYLKRPQGVSLSGGPLTSPNTLVITTQDFKYGMVLLTSAQDEADPLIEWLRT